MRTITGAECTKCDVSEKRRKENDTKNEKKELGKSEELNDRERKRDKEKQNRERLRRKKENKKKQYDTGRNREREKE